MKTFNLNYNTKFYEVIIKIKCFDFSMEDILNYKLADVDLFSSLLNNNFIYLSDLPSNLNSLESTFNAIFIEKLIDELKLIVKNLKSVKMNILIYFIIKYSFPQGINCFSRTQMKNLYLELLFFFPSLDLDRKGLSKKIRSNPKLILIQKGTYAALDSVPLDSYKNFIIKSNIIILQHLKYEKKINVNQFYKDNIDLFMKNNINNVYLYYSLQKLINPPFKIHQDILGNIIFYI